MSFKLKEEPKKATVTEVTLAIILGITSLCIEVYIALKLMRFLGINI